MYYNFVREIMWGILFFLVKLLEINIEVVDGWMINGLLIMFEVSMVRY